MSWLHRYVEAVKRYLPRAKRDDVGEGLHSILEEKLEEAAAARGGPLVSDRIQFICLWSILLVTIVFHFADSLAGKLNPFAIWNPKRLPWKPAPEQGSSWLERHFEAPESVGDQVRSD